MPVPTIAETLFNDTETGFTLTTSGGTAAGDTLIVLHWSDFHTFAGMGSVTSTAGTPAPITTADAGENAGHLKASIIAVGSAGAKNVVFPQHLDAVVHGVVIRINGGAVVDGTPATGTGSGTASHVAPTITTTGADRLLVCGWLTYDAGAHSAGQYAAPGSMVERAENNASPFSASLAATESRPTAGATGTRTATWVRNAGYVSVSIALASLAPAAPARAPRTLSQYGSYF